MATVLSTSLTNATTFTSSSLAVGTFRELSLDFNVTDVTAESGVTMEIFRVGLDSELYFLGSIGFDQVGHYSMDVGVACLSSAAGVLSRVDRTFGDHVELQLVAPVGTQITTTISVTGK